MKLKQVSKKRAAGELSAAEMLAAQPVIRAYELGEGPRVLSKFREILLDDCKQITRNELERGYVHFALMLMRSNAFIDQMSAAEDAKAKEMSNRGKAAADVRHRVSRSNKVAVVNDYLKGNFKSKDYAAEMLAPKFGIRFRTARDYLIGV